MKNNYTKNLLRASFSFLAIFSATSLYAQTGSPIAARTGGLIANVIVGFVFFILFFSIFWIVNKRITTYKNSPAYLEKQKNKPTSEKNISEVAKEAQLVKEEISILRDIFVNKHNTPNLIYQLRDVESTDPFFQEEFQELDQLQDDEAKSFLFSLRHKIFTKYRQLLILQHSQSIPVNTIFRWTPEKGIHYNLFLKANNSSGMYATIPPIMLDEKIKPAALTKVSLNFEPKNGFPYQMEARIVRYDKAKDGTPLVVLAHTGNLVPLSKRTAVRVELNTECQFSFVKAEVNGKKTVYNHAEKTHPGTLEDVSSGGCRIVTKLPIKADQYIYIKGLLGSQSEEEAIGIIIRTTQTRDNTFILHIRFVKIAKKAVNKIMAVACGYKSAG